MDYKFTSDGKGIYFRLTDAEVDAARRLSHQVGTSLSEFISEMMFARLFTAKDETEEWLRGQSQQSATHSLRGK